MTLRLFTKTVTLTHTAGTSVDSAGRPTRTSTVSTVRCAFKHRLASDTLDGGLVVSDEITFYMPPETSVAASDSITMDGCVYEVISDAFPVWNHRFETTHHVEVRGRRTHR